MEEISKIHAIMGKMGKYKTAKLLGFTYPTLMSRIEDPGTLRMSEIYIINKVYDEVFNKNPTQ